MVPALFLMVLAQAGASLDVVDRVLNAAHAFEVLDIDHRAAVDRHAVKSAFHSISLQVHPDKHCWKSVAACEAAGRAQVAAQDAHDILLDARKREELRARLKSIERTIETRRVGVLFVASLAIFACIFLATWILSMARLALRTGSRLYKWLLPSAERVLCLAAAERRRAAAATMVACASIGHAARAANMRRREVMEGIVNALRAEREARKRCDALPPLSFLCCLRDPHPTITARQRDRQCLQRAADRLARRERRVRNSYARGPSPHAKLLWIALLAMLTVLRPPLVPEMSVENGNWNLAEFHLQAEAQMAQEAEALDWLMAAGPEGLECALHVHDTASLHQSLSEPGPLGRELVQNASIARRRAARAARKAEQAWRRAEQAINEALASDSSTSAVDRTFNLASCGACDDDDPEPMNNQVITNPNPNPNPNPTPNPNPNPNPNPGRSCERERPSEGGGCTAQAHRGRRPATLYGERSQPDRSGGYILA